MKGPIFISRTVLALVAIALIIGALLFLNQCSRERTAKTETKLATGQAQASLQSGQDAVATVGAVEGNSSAGDALTKENGDAIKKAPGAGAVVDPAVRAAGRASLCKRAAYRSDPKCVQHPPAR